MIIVFFIFAMECCLTLLMGSKQQPRIKSSEELIPSSVCETEDALPQQGVLRSADCLEFFGCCRC